MMSKVGLRFLVVFTALFAVESLAKPSIDRDLDWFEDNYDRSRSSFEGKDLDRFADNGRPSTSGAAESGCIRDILLVVDMSYSIGSHSFETAVIPFLKKLVQDRTLNVGPDGTQIAMIIFSEERKTKLRFNFGENVDQESLIRAFDGMNWASVSGGHTRTDLALKIANEDVFTEVNPKNNRPKIDDVVIIISDGEPRGARNAEADAYKYADLLKDKDVLVIAAAVGPSRNKFLDKMERMATSAKYVVEAELDKMDEILGSLVASSCIKPGQCICDPIESSPYYVKPGDSKASVSWFKPKYDCWSGRAAEEESFSVSPPVTSPHQFSVGKHTITYTYKLNGGVVVQCPLAFEVKGELCRGIAFNSRKEVCCCGAIFTRAAGHDCCGPDYYNTSMERCCSNANRISREESCPIPA